MFDVPPVSLTNKLFLRSDLFFSRQEQPRRPQKVSGFASIATVASALEMVLELWTSIHPIFIFSFFRPGLFFSRQEQPKKNAPKDARVCFCSCNSALEMVLKRWTPPHTPFGGVWWCWCTGAGALVLVHWCCSVHTAHRPAIGRGLCLGVLPGPN